MGSTPTGMLSAIYRVVGGSYYVLDARYPFAIDVVSGRVRVLHGSKGECVE